MDKSNAGRSAWTPRVAFLSLLLLFFTIPHTLEDFATGEPTAMGVSTTLLSLVVATIFTLQALGLYWLGQRRKGGALLHVVIGLFWPIASGAAQLPTIMGAEVYRAGFISVFFVIGIIVVGSLLLLSALFLLRER